MESNVIPRKLDKNREKKFGSEPMEIFHTPGGVEILGSTRNFRAKDDAVGDIERYVMWLDTQIHFFKVIGLTVPRLTSIGAVGNVEIDQINML